MKQDKDNNSLAIYLICVLFIITLCVAEKYFDNKLYYAGIVLGILIIILKLTVSLRKKIRYLFSRIRKIDNMTGEEFEEYLMVHFNTLGYDVTLTPLSRDFGADLIIEKDEIKTAIQAKRYSNTVGVAAVQQVYAAAAFYDCDNAMVVTNSYFSLPAKQLAEKIGVELWDRDEIINNFNIK